MATDKSPTREDINPSSKAPDDFIASIPTDQLPSTGTQAKVATYPVFDRDGKQHLFQDLYAGPNATDRTMVIFVRHFFCGSCQEYLSRLSAAIPPTSLPPTTSIVIIGCGDPALIPHYAAESSCPYPMYSNPSRNLYDDLDMISTMTVGQKPAYISKTLPRLALEGTWQALKQIPSGLAHKGGPAGQVGGEFLFEGGRVTWCSRMHSSWGHTEIPVLGSVVFGRDVGEELGGRRRKS